MKTVVIPAAGLASRLRPMSNTTSKAMISVNGKPIISYIIDEVKKWSDDIRIVYGQSDDIVEYCKRAYPDLPITYYHQKYATGPLHAVYIAVKDQDYMTIEMNRELVIWLGDTIVTDYDGLQQRNEVVYSEVNDWERWCLIDKEGILHDKPKTDPGTSRALVGIYKFTSMFIAVNKICSICQDEKPAIGNEYQISQLIKKESQMHQVPTNEWYDCGDFPSLYDSRAKLLNRLSREDNHIEADPFFGTVTKSGERCISEINWYQSVPNGIKPFLPAIYHTDNVDDISYTMELCPGSTLQDILVYENLKDDTIEYLIDRVFKSVKYCFDNEENYFPKTPYCKTASIEMWISKNIHRLRSDPAYDQFKLDDVNFLLDILMSEQFERMFVDTMTPSEVIHGDLHFGNILFDFNTGKVKFIDPRGTWGPFINTMGDVEYDYAKLYQSVYCEYMWIINDMPTNYELKNKLIRLMDDRSDHVIKYKILSAIMMATCIPFHNDNPKRQQRLWDTSLDSIKDLF